MKRPYGTITAAARKLARQGLTGAEIRQRLYRRGYTPNGVVVAVYRLRLRGEVIERAPNRATLSMRVPDALARDLERYAADRDVKRTVAARWALRRGLAELMQ